MESSIDDEDFEPQQEGTPHQEIKIEESYFDASDKQKETSQKDRESSSRMEVSDQFKQNQSEEVINSNKEKVYEKERNQERESKENSLLTIEDEEEGKIDAKIEVG